MTATPRDNWVKADVLAKCTGAVLIPVILLLVGNWHTSQMKKADSARHDIDRAAVILRHLASENARERELALHFVEYLDRNGQFPDELYPILISALADEDSVVQRLAGDLLQRAWHLNGRLVDDWRITSSRDAETGMERSVEMHPEVRILYEEARRDDP